ncbi:MAG: LamG-like jellyroll fold domain-containing protein [Planctomycetota bacterium]
MDFNGIDDYVGLPDNDPVWLPQYNFTLSVWVYFERDAGSATEQILDLNFADSGDPSYELGYGLNRTGDTGVLAFRMTTTTNTDEDLVTDDVLAKNKWYHLVAVRDGTTQAIYIDGEPNVSRTCSPDPIDFVGGYDDDKVNIGKFSRVGVNSAFELKGIIDDVRIYDTALNAEEVFRLVQEGWAGKAFNPEPYDGEQVYDTNIILSWAPGLDANEHDVYLGKDFDDVNDANTVTTLDVYQSRSDINYFDACDLEPGNWYYWRVDEVNEANICRGDVWSFYVIGAIIELSETEFNFEAAENGANPANQTLGISNSSLGALNWQVSESCSWLSVAPLAGISTGEVDDVNLSVDITGLGWGFYNCELTVTDPNAENSPQIVTVNLGISDDINDCFPSWHPDYAEWVTVGKPIWWCNPRHCHADADGAQEAIGHCMFWVGFVDLGILVDNWGDAQGIPAAYQADFSHSAETIGHSTFRVGYVDLQIWVDNFACTEIAPDCLDVPLGVHADGERDCPFVGSF